jgi:hypothetical protein
MENVVDNIAAVDTAEESFNEEEYLARFSNITESNQELNNIIKNIDTADCDQNRIVTLMQYVNKLQKQNEMLLDLLIDMNNCFGRGS